jgi:hypothetical protein
MKRMSSSSTAENDDVISQRKKARIQGTSTIVLTKPTRKYPCAACTVHPIYCASTGRANTSSICNNGVDMPTILPQSDLWISGKIRNNCGYPNMNSSAPLQQINPTANDVIYGRGIAANQHNQSFRAEIRSRHDSYARGNAKSQLEIVTELIEWVRNRGGRFLSMDSTNYVEIDESVVSSKIRQSLRDCKSIHSNRNPDAETTLLVGQPTDRDVVVCGRGTGTAATQHDRSFHEQADTRHFDCVQDEEVRKMEVANELIKWVQTRQGQFVEKDSNDCFDMNELDVNDTIRQRFITDHDVIFRRGQPANEGTHSYRELLHRNGLAYVSCNDDRARQLEIVDDIRGRIRNKGGRFFTLHSGRSLIELNDVGVNERIRQGLRDSASKQQEQNHGM